MENLLLLNENEFFDELEKSKHIVDKGISEYFINVENVTTRNISGMKKLTLAEIEECYGEEYIYFFVFAYNNNSQNADDPEKISSLRYRRIKERDKKTLRGFYRYFPRDCWVCEWRDAAGNVLVLPFIQNNDSTIKFLYEIPMCRKDLQKFRKLETPTVPQALTNEIMEKLPWYTECMYAIVNYKGVDIVIPIAPEGCKKTFKNRERDEDGVKRHLIHYVEDYQRINLKNSDKVSGHTRGTSDLKLRGEDIVISASWNISMKELKRRNAKNG
jgi:hypothetical protein